MAKEIKEQLLELGFKNNKGSCYYEYNGNTPSGENLRIGIHIRNWNWYAFSAERWIISEWKQKHTKERCVLDLSKNELPYLMNHFSLFIAI